VCSQVQGECLDSLGPRPAAVGEDVVVNFAEQPLDQGLHHRGLVREVGVDRVRGHADLRRDAADRGRVRAAVVEQAQRGVEDLVLGEGPAGSTTPSPDRFCCRLDRLH
jgi:hypothetical protein